MRADELMVDPVLAAKGPAPQASSFVGARWFRSDAATAAIGGAASSGDHGRLLRVMAGCMGYETDRLSFSSKPGGIQLFPEGEGASAAVAAPDPPPGLSCRAQVRDGTGAVTALGDALCSQQRR